MAQISIANSVSTYQPPIQTGSLGTCAVDGVGVEPIHNASIGGQWGDCRWNYTGTTDTSNDKWDDLTNINGRLQQTAVGSQKYGFPYFESDGASPPWMSE